MVNVGVENLGHERAADPAHGLHLAGQPTARGRLHGHPRMQHLDGHRAAFPVAGEVDRSHAAFAEPVLQTVRPELFRYSVL